MVATGSTSMVASMMTNTTVPASNLPTTTTASDNQDTS